MTNRRFVILDRDGTIIKERNYLSDPNLVELIPDVAGGLRQFSAMGLGLVVVTNQSAIGRGIIDRTVLSLIHKRMCSLLEVEGIWLDGIYFCPHIPEDNCWCRKPRTALIEMAAKELSFDPQTSFVIGDKICDIGLGQNVGATTLLVRTGYGPEVAAQKVARPDYIVDSLEDAALVIEHLLIQDKRKALR